MLCNDFLHIINICRRFNSAKNIRCVCVSQEILRGDSIGSVPTLMGHSLALLITRIKE